MYCTVKPDYNAIVRVERTPSKNRKSFLRWNNKWDKYAQIEPKFFQKVLFYGIWSIGLKNPKDHWSDPIQTSLFRKED